jgi:hypothetical protein
MFQAFLMFRIMITSWMIRAFYVLGALGITATSVWIVVQPSSDLALLGVPGVEDPKIRVVAGLVYLVLGNLMWRLSCEAAIILFSIHDILESLERTPTQGTGR